RDRASAWLQLRAQPLVQRGHRYRHVRSVPGGHLGQDVEIARDEGVLGDEAHRVPEPSQHLQYGAGDLQLALDGLVGVRDAGDGDALRRPVGRPQTSLQEGGRVALDEDDALEVEAGREAQVLVRRPGVAVGAAVLTAAVWVDADVEADVRAVVAGYR